MPKRHRWPLVFGVVVVLANPVAADSFSDHLVPPYKGQLVMPDFSGAQAKFRNFRTRISQGIHEQGITFAGSWSVIAIGCGTGCVFGYAVDLSNGSITPLPIGGEEFLYSRLFYEPYSNLLKATWTDGWPPDGRCMVGEWLLQRGEFRERRVYKHTKYEDCTR